MRLWDFLCGRRGADDLAERMEHVERIAEDNSRARLEAERRLERLEAGLRALERERDLLWVE